MVYRRHPVSKRSVDLSNRPRLPYAEEQRMKAVAQFGPIPGLMSTVIGNGTWVITGDWNPEMVTRIVAKGFIPTGIEKINEDTHVASLYAKKVSDPGISGAIDHDLKGCKVAKLAHSMQEFVHDTTTMYDAATRDTWVVRFNASPRLTLFGRMDHLWHTGDAIWIGIDGKYVPVWGCDQYTKGSDVKRANELEKLFTFLGLM